MAFSNTFLSFYKLTYSKFVLLFFLPLGYLSFKKKVGLKEEWRGLFQIFLWGLVLIIPQLFLYTKSGIYERYLIPLILFVEILFSWPLETLVKERNFENSSLKEGTNLKLASFALLLLCLTFITSEDLRGIVLGFYSNLKGKAINPHYEIKLVLFSLGLFFIGVLGFCKSNLKANNFCNVLRRKLELKSRAAGLTFLFLLFSLVDRAVITYRFGKDFSDIGEVIAKTLNLFQEHLNEKIAIISDPVAYKKYNEKLLSYGFRKITNDHFYLYEKE